MRKDRDEKLVWKGGQDRILPVINEESFTNSRGHSH